MGDAVAGHGLIVPERRPVIPGGGPQTVAEVLDEPARVHPDREALVGRSGRFTYRELDEVAARAAGALWGLGVRPGDRVGASLPNVPEIVVAFLAAMRIGAVWVGVNRVLAPKEKAYELRDAGVSVLLADDDAAEQLAPPRTRGDLPDLRHVVRLGEEWDALVARGDDAPAVDIDPFAPAAIAYTSGTTGYPKGAVHSQHNLLVPGAVYVASGLWGHERYGVALPLTVLNLIVLCPLVAFQQGTTVVCIDRVDAAGLAEWIRAERVQTFSAVPTMVYDLLTAPDVADDDLVSLVRPGVGGADCPPAIRELYEKRFGVPIVSGYGLTEAPTSVTVERAEGPFHTGAAGWPLPHVRITIRDDEGRELHAGEVGEICVEAVADGAWAGVYTPFLGYWNQPDASAEALRGDVLHTGDIGALGADGSLFVKGRRSEVIIRGGANVYPAEVERVLHDDARVAACAVVGCPDERLGERVVAYVQLAPGAPASEDDLRAHCLAELARYKVPERWVFVDDLPRNAMGKVVKTRLRPP